MKRLLMLAISIIVPWLVLLLYDNPGGALVALIMQATGIGWPFATVWAWKVAKPHLKKEPK
jgi:multisubunit Na+/H+ antiporter MnhB subunit